MFVRVLKSLDVEKPQAHHHRPAPLNVKGSPQLRQRDHHSPGPLGHASSPGAHALSPGPAGATYLSVRRAPSSHIALWCALAGGRVRRRVAQATGGVADALGLHRSFTAPGRCRRAPAGPWRGPHALHGVCRPGRRLGHTWGTQVAMSGAGAGAAVMVVLRRCADDHRHCRTLLQLYAAAGAAWSRARRRAPTAGGTLCSGPPARGASAATSAPSRTWGP